jgi:hypothetical protein
MLMKFLPYIAAAAVVVILLAGFSGRTKGGTALVLKQFKLNEKENDFLLIEGRTPGFFGWLLSLWGIDPVTILRCNRQSIQFEEASVSYGKNTLNIPLVAITGIFSGVKKPFYLLVLGVLCAVGGIIGSIVLNIVALFIIGAMLGTMFIVFYALRKTMTIGIYNGGDKPAAVISMKKSIIENLSIDELKCEAAAQALKRSVLRMHVSLAMTGAAAAAPAPRQRTAY